jgi:formylglycine-generating enzyme required for sulfatase activity
MVLLLKVNIEEKPPPVGSFKVANNFGLYDMHGNVWQWCLDDRYDNYEAVPTDGSAWFDDKKDLAEKEGRSVVRGGPWNLDPGHCRSAFRHNNVPRFSICDHVGFRVVCAL